MYFGDFVCREKMLVVELDGSQHAESAYDNRRAAMIVAEGYRVLRFWNADVLRDMSMVRETIMAAAERRLRPYDQYRTPKGLP